jgi:hypothetical protein
MGTAPDGSPAIEVLARHDAPNFSQYWPDDVPGLLGRNATHARISVELYLQPGYQYRTTGSGKYGIGLWGGDSRTCTTGGCPQGSQTGWYIRLNWSHGDYSGIPMLAAKTFNQPTHSGATGALRLNGRLVQFPRGQWIKVFYEVQLNTPGIGDGWAEVAAFDASGRPIGSMKRTGLLFRYTDAWKIRGPLFTEMWGGPHESSSQWPPQTQKSWYRNYRIEVPAN